MSRLTWCVAILLATGSISATAFAQDAKPKASTPDSDPQNPGLWNTDIMMEAAVQQLTRRYNLNKDQEAYTRKLLTTKVRAFLREHEGELRSLLAEAIELQRNPTRVDARRMEEWAVRALPIFQAARTAILDGNREWGVILDVDQKRVHQTDLDQMDGNFKDMDEKFTRWSKGGFKPEDLVPKARTVTSKLPPPGRNQSLPEDAWDVQVNQIIGLYRYTKEQETQARGILQDCKKEAARFRESNKDKLKEIQDRVNVARDRMWQKKGSPDEIRKIEAQLKEILRPVTEDLFKKLMARVEGLATAQQRTAVETLRREQKKRIEESRRAYEERRKLASTQPASDQSTGGVGQPLKLPPSDATTKPAMQTGG